MALGNKRTPRKFIKDRTGTNNISSDAITRASSSMTDDIFSKDPAYVDGHVTPLMYHADLMQEDIDEIRRFLTGSMVVPSSVGVASSAGDIGSGAETIDTGNSGITDAGAIYYKSSTSWAHANATSAGAASYGFIGVSLGTNMSNGFCIRGIVYVGTDPGGSIGDIVYLSTSDGRLTTTAPSANGNVVRVMGHKIGTNLVYFNPSTNWIELSV